VLALFLFFPAIASVPTVVAQDEVMEFVIAYPQDLGELNPIFPRSARSMWYNMLIYDSLLSYDENLDLIPWLAEDYNVSTDRLEVNFTLREDATWHDGHPVTPQDVKFTFEHMRDGPVDSYAWSFLQHITNVRVIGQDIIVTLDQVFSFAENILGELYILPKHIREGVAADDVSWNDPSNVTAQTGSGMFKYVERIPAEFTMLDRFDDWWGPNNPRVGQLPSIERVRIDVIRTQDARILAMRNGDCDTELYEVFGGYVTTILNAPELKLITGVPTVWNYFLGMNTLQPGLDDVEVRKAISYAINRQELISMGRFGFGTATQNVIPDAFFPEEHHTDGDFPEQNITIANQILDAAGWADTNMNGIRDNGAGVELSYDLWALSWDDSSVGTGTGLKLQLEEIGFEVNVMPIGDDPMYPGVFVTPRTFEMYVMGLAIGPYPNHPWWRMHSENDHDWGGNPYGWVNSTFDDILDDYMAATPTEFLDAARLVQIAATENIPFIPLYLSDDTHALRTEWINYTMKRGGLFTGLNPETMVFMYDSTMMPTTTPITSTTTTGTTTPPPPDDSNLIMLMGIGAGGIMVGVVCTSLIYRRRE
jgi:ABC-type transport system substrate-binding protein